MNRPKKSWPKSPPTCWFCGATHTITKNGFTRPLTRMLGGRYVCYGCRKQIEYARPKEAGTQIAEHWTALRKLEAMP